MPLAVLKCIPCVRGASYCSECQKPISKPYYKLSPEEKEEWSYFEGELLCLDCSLEVERGKWNPHSSSRDLLSTSRKGTPVKRDSRLKTLQSGKRWERTISFNAPYKESPEVSQKVSKCKLYSVVLQIRGA